MFLDGTLAPEDAVYFTDEDQQKTINGLFDSADMYLKKLSLVEFAVINQAIAFYRRCGDKLLKIKKTSTDVWRCVPKNKASGQHSTVKPV